MSSQASQLAIRQITDFSRVDLGTHYALIDGDKVIARAVGGVTLADLRYQFRALSERPRRTRGSYRKAIQWIADNDESGVEMTPEECGELVTACLVAEIFGVSFEKVGRDIFRARKAVRS